MKRAGTSLPGACGGSHWIVLTEEYQARHPSVDGPNEPRNQRLLEIRRASHNLNRSHLVCMGSNVHPSIDAGDWARKLTDARWAGRVPPGICGSGARASWLPLWLLPARKAASLRVMRHASCVVRPMGRQHWHRWRRFGVYRAVGEASPETEGVRVPVVSVRHLAKSYGDKQAVRDVSFEVQKGEVFALLGPNGAGKTTTIEILEGFRNRTSGEVSTLGVDPADRATQRWLRSRIGVVLQELAVEPFYTVRQVLSRNAGYYPSPRPVDEVIEVIGLKEKADQRVKKLSGGQQRRLDVGLGIIGQPELLFLDEPTTGLDPLGRRDSWNLIRQLTAEGTTVMLTTHYMDEVEALADRVAVLNNAEIVASGTPTSIGGRDSGMVTIRFALPEGVAVADVPLPVQSVDDGLVTVQTDDELRALHLLTGWALEKGLALPGLSVARVSLEDIYLDLTRSAQ